MIVHTIREIYCDLCGEPLGSCVDPAQDLEQQRELAKDQGWLRKRCAGRIIDICSSCQDEQMAARLDEANRRGRLPQLRPID